MGYFHGCGGCEFQPFTVEEAQILKGEKIL
jgi:hypothetical protein